VGIRAASREDGREGSEEASESIVVLGSSIAWRRVLYEKQEVYSVQVHHNTSGAPQSLNPPPVKRSSILQQLPNSLHSAAPCHQPRNPARSLTKAPPQKAKAAKSLKTFQVPVSSSQLPQLIPAISS
jgi:hypothetical protein